MSDYNIDIRYSSEAQRKAMQELMSGNHRTILVEGGSGSGKTWVALVSMLRRAMLYPKTEHYALKTDLKALKSAMESSVLELLRSSGVPPARSRKSNNTYFWDASTGTLHLGNGSNLYLRPVRSPRPQSNRGDASLLGINADTLYLDEATTVYYEWYEFFETRVRSITECPPLLVLSQNPDARCWTHFYFRQDIDPHTMDDLTATQKNNKTVVRIEAWENILANEQYLEQLKNSGNALRFYYGEVDTSPDWGQIYQWTTAPFESRMYNIYAIDPGYQAHTAIIQLGFGGNYDVNIRELVYAQGYGHADFMREVGKIIEYHEALLQRILSTLSPGQHSKLTAFQLMPHIIVDCARVDLIKDIEKEFNWQKIGGYTKKMPRCVVIPSRKGESKYYSIERVKKLRQIIDGRSKNYLREISQYRYDQTASNDERVPDGNDDLLDASLYAMRYALEDVFNKQPNSLVFDTTRQQIYDKIKTIEIQ